ncbi:dimethylaniline monooxygenase [Rhizobium leguminosarum]|uniref:Trimethylamine monooxygenase n=1 Tax=Rhizobium leguminosarum TaxID=384 RepID=A0A1L3Z953_RHILE|nr:NAD(P)-binding domain-containing protein [Rhizobium leguminosarum]API52091.1 dimethylaniline monooxygenase [Rhizobium leguminosarum]
MSTKNHVNMPENAVAVIGAGPAGLVAARYLIARGLVPIIFEASSRLGGQWNSASAASAIWPGMRTNTSRVMTAFSDLDHTSESAAYPRQEEMLDYLERYAFTLGLLPHLRLKTRVERLERADNGWLISSAEDKEVRSEVFQRVVVATGRQNLPDLPAVPGLDGFAGALGAVHTAQYNGSERYRGRKVLVAGCSISALEIASDIALGGAAQVVSSNRRQRYILPKVIAGVPTDHVMFSRAAVLMESVLPPEMLAEGLTMKVLKVAGSPDQFGAPRPEGNAFVAGISQSQGFLPAVAEGRIAVKPWMERVDGHTVWFRDGTSVNVDAILFGTGYRLSMPWLSEDIIRMIRLDGYGADLHDHTFHPDLPGLAFLGLFDLIGPAFPVLELQARWVAQCFGSSQSLPARAAMLVGVERSRATRSGPINLPMHVAALTFARNAGAEPDLTIWPDLERALLFGPLSPISFRLQGPDLLPHAPAKTKAAAAAFGGIITDDFTPEEEGIRQLLKLRPVQTAA